MIIYLQMMMLCYSLVKSFNYSVESTTAVRQKRSESGKAFEINYLHHRSIVNRACLIIFFSLRVFHVLPVLDDFDVFDDDFTLFRILLVSLSVFTIMILCTRCVTSRAF